MHPLPVERLVNLLDPTANIWLNTTAAEAETLVASGDAEKIRGIDGQFALVAKRGHIVRLARSIGRPLRYFLAKQIDGPCLIVAERIEEIQRWLTEAGLADQFHPSYTRMVPAHYLVELAIVGCPDPNPNYIRYFAPQRNSLPPDLDVIGREYVTAIAHECERWLDRIGPREPIGVLFSGGVDSGALLVLLHHLLLRRGESPARLKAFTLAVDGQGADVEQAHRFLAELDLTMLLEVIDVPATAIDYRAAIRVIEDYKPLDVQAATMGWALCRGIRERYPQWKCLVDGDGGDENLKDYPIAENSELTIRSVLNNLMLYHEGWGVDAIKHSLTFTGGQSRGHVRTYAPARMCGFEGFSPYALPNVIAVSEAIPFIELTGWSEDRLYALKGEVMRRGIEAVTGVTLPVFEKRRFQHGAAAGERQSEFFPAGEAAYRRAFEQTFA